MLYKYFFFIQIHLYLLILFLAIKTNMSIYDIISNENVFDNKKRSIRYTEVY